MPEVQKRLPVQTQKRKTPFVAASNLHFS